METIETKQETKLFYCYSCNLKNYLVNNGIPYIATDYHKITKKKYWVFLNGRMLSVLFEEYRNNKPIKQ